MPYKDAEARRKHNRQYYLKNRTKALEYARIYRQNNKEKIIDLRRRYRAKNRDKILERLRIYYAKYGKFRPRDHKKMNAICLFGSLETYLQALQKYDGQCALGCDSPAELVHHIDGRSLCNSPKKLVNNNLSNLLPLCKACHNWLHHWKHGNRCKKRIAYV